MSHPLVVHCKRKKYDVYVGRPSKWGNPIKLIAETDRAVVLVKYRAWLDGAARLTALYGEPPSKAEIVQELHGKVLACWCAPRDCHADVLAEIANAEGTSMGDSK